MAKNQSRQQLIRRFESEIKGRLQNACFADGFLYALPMQRARPSLPLKTNVITTRRIVAQNLMAGFAYAVAATGIKHCPTARQTPEFLISIYRRSIPNRGKAADCTGQQIYRFNNPTKYSFFVKRRIIVI
ncbi:hypothetical protein [Neisseria animalis]|uniref:hypothetical protein n=1 Tax=Neisseria animalis TaxID=492 RepID=UPI000F4F0341|nr:hypothetical protein [Neisseria animalis]